MGYIYLQTGEIFEGQHIGAKGAVIGELVFNTTMVGYQELLTDPSYAGQIITMTYPLIGNYGTSTKLNESAEVAASGLIIKKQSDVDSHFESEQTLSDFLEKHNTVGIANVDTRAITRHIRSRGVVLAIISSDQLSTEKRLELFDTFIGVDTLANLVGVKEITPLFKARSVEKLHIGIIDLGVKNNIVNSLIKRNADVTLFPRDVDANTLLNSELDGVLVSNGPGDPALQVKTIQTVKDIVGKLPLFGICFGNQILALALGASTYKMKYGHRGGNHGVQNIFTKQSYIVAQNHGYAVDEQSLVNTGLIPLFKNLNDSTIEGIVHQTYPAFSVQFHPESNPGPTDMEFLFDEFIEMIELTQKQISHHKLSIMQSKQFTSKDDSIKKVLILGSGPIVIGQAAEFDYSGTQGCKAMKEEGIEVVLLNSNPATIMTDQETADYVYIEPLTVDSVVKIIKKEQPDGILAGFGGQTALNLAMELSESGVLAELDVPLLGIKPDAINKAESRDLFKDLLNQIGEPSAESYIATTFDEAMVYAKKIGFPIIVRPAFTLGGSGGGVCEDEATFIDVVKRGLNLSPISQVLVEKSLLGYKEIEYEVMRDKKGNFITVCNMENFDPVGIHTGDSIVVAPSQTLTNDEYQMLRNSSKAILEALDLQGGCNVQFALDPHSKQYYVIEVNPRVSRSSALASKATGYPIAKVAAKIALGYCLDEILNDVTKSTSAFFEPALDYIVVKIPKWPFEKFTTANQTLNTQMKATGEVMAIARTFEEGFMKALVSLEGDFTGLQNDHIMKMETAVLIEKIIQQESDRLFAIAELFRRQMTVAEIHSLSKIDYWFLEGIKNIVGMERNLSVLPLQNNLHEAEKMGFVDEEISRLSNTPISDIIHMRQSLNMYATYKTVDTCAAEFESQTPYYYSTFEMSDEVVTTDNAKVAIIGSGPIRIGQGIEFDYASVHGAWALKKSGIESIIINNNPETVSTDFDTADKLYFESLQIDDIMNVMRKEKPNGVILQLGGQTAINLAHKIKQNGISILGTQPEAIDLAEDREKFRAFLEENNIVSPDGAIATSYIQAKEIANQFGYPVMLRPSYVIGGRAMRVVYSDSDMHQYIGESLKAGVGAVYIDKYISGIEIEVDALCDGENIFIPGIMEHIEKTGVHSGDSITVYPPQTLPASVIAKLVETTKTIATKIGVIGLVNIQYAYANNTIYVIEVNPRASRTIPILSKITDTPMVDIAIQLMLGKKLSELGYNEELKANKNLVAYKVPVFSTEKLDGVDTFLGPEMKSIGEILAIDFTKEQAIQKAFEAIKVPLYTTGKVYVSLNEYTKTEAKALLEQIDKRFEIEASLKTAAYLKEIGINANQVSIADVMASIDQYSFILNTPTSGFEQAKAGYQLRRKCIEYKKLLFTNFETAALYLKALESKEVGIIPSVERITKYREER